MTKCSLWASALACSALGLSLFCASSAAPPASPRFVTLTGCSGKSIEEYGVPRDVYGTWMARNSWDDLAKANWIWVKESGVPDWRRDHFDRALDVGTPLIPTDSKQDWNALLDEAASGTQDETYRSLGRNLALYGTKIVYARVWWEFNIPPAKEDPARFIKAWRRAVPLLRDGFKSAAQPGQVLHIVWCTNADKPDPEPFYPGDAFVDVIGTDVYGWKWGNADPTTDAVLERIRSGPYTLNWLADFANRHKKPTCLGEWGNVAKKGDKPDDGHGLGDSAAYIDAIYDWTQTCRYGCRYVCYFNLPDGGVGETLDQTPDALARLKVRAAQARQPFVPRSK